MAEEGIVEKHVPGHLSDSPQDGLVAYAFLAEFGYQFGTQSPLSVIVLDHRLEPQKGHF
jgi:hypothetical protein